MRCLSPRGAWAVLATLGLLVAFVVPELGSDPWPFHPPSVHPHDVLGPVVRAADRHWDLGFIRTPGILAGMVVAAVALLAWRRRTWRVELLGALCVVVIAALLVPAVLLQVGLRQATHHPWYYVNDSTFQIELAGDLVRHGHNPYGYDYAGTGLYNWYGAAGFAPGFPQVALKHFAYFPGTALTAAVWDAPSDQAGDYRFFVTLTTLLLFAAFLLFRAPLGWRLALGSIAAANPLAVRAAWFGTADAPSLLCLVLAFALLSRRRLVWAALLLGIAVLLKQFALVAVPFFAVAVLALRPPGAVVRKAAAAFVLPLAAGILPFFVADPGAFWRDTITYGGSTYRIVGYGLSNLFLKAGIVDDRFGYYPFFWLALLVWLPVTFWLLWQQRRAARLWAAAAAFAVSIFVLFFVSRVFQTSYLIWPLTAVLVAAALAADPDDERLRARADVAREVDRSELEPVPSPP
jgi:Glycosyltransferase family 87